MQGWRKAHESPEEEKPVPPSDDEFTELLSRSRVH